MTFGDSVTMAYYQKHADTVFKRYQQVEGGIANFFSSALLPGSRVLDIGAGSGRDVEQLLGLGFDAYGIEPVAELRELAMRETPELVNRMFAGYLPDGLRSALPEALQTPGSFDAIVCSAVLMHLPEEQLPRAMQAMATCLNDNGRMLLSIPASRQDVGDDYRDPNGRLFSPVTPDQLNTIAESLGFWCVDEHVTKDAQGREGTRWHTLLFVRDSV